MDMFTDEEFATLRNIIGSIVLSWGQMEGTLTLFTHVAFQLVGPTAEFPNKRPPYEFARKIRYLKTALRDHHPFAPFREEGRELLRRAKALAKAREAITHGYISGFEREEAFIWFERYEMQETKRVRIRNRFYVPKLGERATEAKNLAIGFAKFMENFLEFLPSENPPKKTP